MNAAERNQRQFNAITVRNAMRAAFAARDAHAEQCSAWDYEGSDCLECQELAAKARRAAKAWDRAFTGGVCLLP